MSPAVVKTMEMVGVVGLGLMGHGIAQSVIDDTKRSIAYGRHDATTVDIDIGMIYGAGKPWDQSIWPIILD
jgi:prephenate dehydrogenase